MNTPTPAQPASNGLPDRPAAGPDVDLSNLKAAYAALNEGNRAPIVDLLDPQVHMRGPENGHLWWRTHRTWNGPGEVGAELTRRSLPDPRQSPIEARMREPTPIGSRFLVEYHTAATLETIQTGHGRDVDFYEVITMRGGKIVLLADYRSQRTAHSVPFRPAGRPTPSRTAASGGLERAHDG